MSKSVRIRDIASASGFSVGAVSRALKGQPGIGDKPRTHIIQTAREWVMISPACTAIKSSGSCLFFTNSIISHSHCCSIPPLLMEVEAVCRENDIALSFLALGPMDPVEKLVRQHNPDGLLVVGYMEQELLASLQKLQLPVTLVDLFSPDLNSVNPDNQRGGYLATHHLISLGRQRIAFLASSLAHYSIQQRERGYRLALYEAGLLMPPDYEAIAPCHLPPEQGLEVTMQNLLTLPEPPDALFAYNDAAALIALRVSQRMGFRVPEDIAIIGFDGIDGADLNKPSLSTIRVDRKARGPGRRGATFRTPCTTAAVSGCASVYCLQY